jgi:acetyl esterase/lipase
MPTICSNNVRIPFGTCAAPDTAVSLVWWEFPPTDGSAGPWPFMGVVHGGGFRDDQYAPQICQVVADFNAKGFFCVVPDYRLAPPGSLPGQVSDGRYPLQHTDIQTFCAAMLADARCNGFIFGCGGSAGATHIAWNCTMGTQSVNQFIAGICLSGAYAYYERAYNADGTGTVSSDFINIVVNYASYVGGVSDPLLTAGHPLFDRSPNQQNLIACRPVFMVNSMMDPMPPRQQEDLSISLLAAGKSDTTPLWSNNGFCKTYVTGGLHAFANWNTVSAQAVQFIQDAYAAAQGNIPPPPPPPAPGNLLPYTRWLTSSLPGAMGNVQPIVFGNATTDNITNLTPSAPYTYHIVANNQFGSSPEATYDFMSDPPGGGGGATFKDKPVGLSIIFTQPGGIYPTGLENYPFWSQDEITGTRYRTEWDHLQPTKTSPDFSEISTYLALCNTRGKKACLSVSAGITTPTWALAAGTPVTFLDDPDAGTMLMPWDAGFISLFSKFIKQLGQAFDSDPALLYVVVSGFGRLTETILCQSSGDTTLADNAAIAAGFSNASAGWLSAVASLIPVWKRAFPTTNLVMSLANVVPNSHSPTGSATIQAAVDAMFGTYPPASQNPNIGLMNAGLNSSSDDSFLPNHLVRINAPVHPAGFQVGSASADEPTFLATMNAGVALDAHYIEITTPDAQAPAFLADRIATAAALVANNINDTTP